jgi:hypothetical protein
MTDVLILLGSEILALTQEQLAEARQRGQELLPVANLSLGGVHEDTVLDAEGMEGRTGIPASWYLEQARQGKIPHIRAGKYVRFRLGEVLEALKADPRHADRLSVHVPKAARNQPLAKGCYRVATKN